MFSSLSKFKGLSVAKLQRLQSNCFECRWRSTETVKQTNSSASKNDNNEQFAVLRVDTHGNRFIVEQNITNEKAVDIERQFDKLTLHQGYYVVPQGKLQEELSRQLD